MHYVGAMCMNGEQCALCWYNVLEWRTVCTTLVQCVGMENGVHYVGTMCMNGEQCALYWCNVFEWRTVCTTLVQCV